MKKTLFMLSVSFFLSFSFAYSQWASSGNDIYNTNSNNVGIGSSFNIAERLTVNGNIQLNDYENVYSYRNIRQLGRVTMVCTANPFNDWNRGLIGQGIIWDNTNFVWNIDGGPYSDFAAFRFDNGGAIGFYTRETTGSTYSLTQSQMESYRRMYISPDGKVGIGRKPEFNFDAVGIGRFGAADNTNANLIIQGGGNVGYNAYWITGTNNILRIGGAGSTEPSLGALNITYEKKVGIGREPEFNLDVISTARFGTTASNENANVIIQGGAGNYNAFWLTGSTNTLKIGGAGGTEPSLGAINIDYTGSVGIGTTNTGSFKLAVEGKIGARELKVTLQNPWPDYVLDKNYDLLPINELETFIRTHHHLPGIPSAQEVKEKDGIEVGAMSIKLLEKIEELSLYIIELKKEIDKLKKKSNQ